MKYNDFYYYNHENRLKKEKDLRKAEAILKEELTDDEKAFRLYKIFHSSEDFKSSYFYLADEKDSYYFSKNDIIQNIYMKIVDFEKNGLYAKAKVDSKYRLISNPNIDSRVIINNYINDADSYKFNEFLDKNNITRENFKSCVGYIKRQQPDTYAKFLEIQALNKNKELFMPIYYLSEIKEGIKSGTTKRGDSFDIYEFWRLNPFKTESIDVTIKNFKKIHPSFERVGKLNSDLYKIGKKPLGYKDMFCNIIEVLGFDKEHDIKNFMEENNIKTCALLNRNRIINNLSLYNYNNLPIEDINNILDFIDSENIPYVKDCYDKAYKDYCFQITLPEEHKTLYKELKYNMLDKKEE